MIAAMLGAASAEMKFALPPSLGKDQMRNRADRLERFLSRSLGTPWKIVVAESYDALAKDILSGRLDAAWAPPFVCARIEAMGVRVLVRGVRRGASTYRAALLCRSEARISIERLNGLTALWVDRDSVGGYLLPMAYLKSRGLDPQKTFFSQQFAGSYRAAIEGVMQGRAEVTSIFAPPANVSPDALAGMDDVAPEHKKGVSVVAVTDESPNDGVVVSMSAQSPLVAALEKTFVEMHKSSDNASLLKDIFNAERFEVAPKMGYRTLYRVALASI
jgi:phosphonate transport system substrate-binding protein